MQTTLFTILIAIFARIAYAAIPPACLLHGVNTQDEPSDLSAVCGNGATKVQSFLAQNCGNYEQDAQKAFIATCSSAGTSVAAYTATASGSRVTSAARSSGTASGTGAATKSTAGANIYYRDGMGAMGAAAVALVGAVAAL